MAKKNSGLARGIDSIFLDNVIPDTRRSTENGGKMTIRLSAIDRNASQPRKDFDEGALQALADSIKQYGVLQPILVRKNGMDRYQIVAGERRYRAAKMAGLSEIPAITVTGDAKDAAKIAMIENIQREDLNPLEEAMGYRSLIREYGMTQEEVASTVGASRSAVANALRLLDLPEDILVLLSTGELTPGHGRAILLLDAEEDMPLLASRILDNDLSVRAAEDAARRMNQMREAAAKAADKPEKAVPPKVDFIAVLENRMMQSLGRRVKISATRKNKSVTLFYEDNEDLDELLRKICGNGFTDEV